MQINTVGFYQISKIAITPVVVTIEAIFYAKYPSKAALAATGVLLVGIALATVTDQQVGGAVAPLWCKIRSYLFCFVSFYLCKLVPASCMPLLLGRRHICRCMVVNIACYGKMLVCMLLAACCWVCIALATY